MRFAIKTILQEQQPPRSEISFSLYFGKTIRP